MFQVCVAKTPDAKSKYKWETGRERSFLFVSDTEGFFLEYIKSS